MELCERLPWWDAWLGAALAVLVALCFGVPGFALVIRHARKKLAPSTAHWTERARAASEQKAMALIIGIFSMAMLALLDPAWDTASGCSRPGPAVAGGALLVVLLFRALGAIDAAYRGSARSTGERLRSMLTVVIAFQPGFFLLFVTIAASSLAPEDGFIWVWVAGVGVLYVIAGTGIVYRLARPLGLAWPARPAVVRAVERAQSDLPTRVTSIDEVAWLMPNALVLPLLGNVIFTKAAADSMSEDELHAIALHELGHLHESRLVRTTRPLRGLLFLPYSVAVPLFETDRLPALLGLVAGSVVLSFAILRLSRHNEKEADAHASAHSPSYARALEHLYELGGVPAVLTKSSTHPSLYDRMIAAGVTPSYPRPAPPRRGRNYLVAALGGFVAMSANIGVSVGRHSIDPLLGPEGAALVRVAVYGRPSDLFELAHETRDAKLAELAYARAVADDPSLTAAADPD